MQQNRDGFPKAAVCPAFFRPPASYSRHWPKCDPQTQAPLAWHFFSGEPPQKLAVSRLLGREALRMAAKLRSYERQTTPPGRAEELPAPKTWKQHNFLTGSPEKKCHARGALCLRTALRPVPAVRGGRTEKRLDKRQLWENWTWQAQRTVIEYH